MSKNSKRKRQSIGQTMGGVVVGFDQQVFRTTPPPHELVLKGTPVRGLSGEDGGESALELVFPDEAPVIDDQAEDDAAAGG